MKILKKIKKDRTLSIRLTENAYANLEKMAKRNGVSKADVIEALINEESKKSQKS